MPTTRHLPNINQNSSFGCALKEREFSSSKYRYGFNGQEKQTEITNSTSHYTAEFWMYDSRLGRRWNIDPKRSITLSTYSCFASNPIFYSDPFGDTVKFERFRDRVNVFTAKIFNKEFREANRMREASRDVYTYKNNQNAEKKVIDATTTNMTGQQFSGHFVTSNKFEIEYVERKGIRIAYGVLGFVGGIGELTFSFGKIPFGLITLGIIKIRNIFTPDEKDAHWGMAGFASVGEIGEGNFISYGFGDWESYNMWGNAIDYGFRRGYNMSGLLGFRWSAGDKTRINFIDFGPQIETHLHDYYLHMNLAPRKLRDRYLHREKKWDTQTPDR